MTKSVYIESYLQNEPGGSQKLAFIDKKLRNLMPKVILLHKNIHLTQKNPEQSYKNIVEIQF